MATKEAAKPEVKEGEQVLLMHISEIHADFNWNARSGQWWLDDESEVEPEQAEEGEEKPKKSKKVPKVDERTKFSDLKKSILETGTNEQPVLARPPTGKTGKIRLVCGFMRYKAIIDLSKDADDKGPTDAQKGMIRVVVRQMTDQEARLSNIRENTSRDDLKGPDLCWSVGEALKKFDYSDTTLAATLGKSQGYISKLHRIYDALTKEGKDMRVLEKWRSSPIPVTIDLIQKEVVLITNKNSEGIPSIEEQMDNFDRVILEKAKGSKGRGPDGWIVTKAKQAGEIGELLGLMQGANLIAVVEEDPRLLVFTVIELPARYKKLDPKKQAKAEKQIVTEFNNGVASGLLKAQEDKDEDEDEDEE